MSITDEENRQFNEAVHRMLQFDNTPGCSQEPISKDDVATCLRLIWQHIGGAVTLTLSEEWAGRECRIIKR